MWEIRHNYLRMMSEWKNEHVSGSPDRPLACGAIMVSTHNSCPGRKAKAPEATGKGRQGLEVSGECVVQDLHVKGNYVIHSF